MPYRRKKRRNKPQAPEIKLAEPIKADLCQIPIENVLEVWPLADEFIKAGCAHSELEPGQLLADTLSGNTQLWFAWSDHLEAAAITRVDVPRCILMVCAGKGMDNWLGLLDGIEQWAALNKCTSMRIYGRKGWARKLPDYRITRFVLDKDL